MLRRVNWLARGLGYLAEGWLILLNPPHGTAAVAVTIVGYVVLGLGLLAWGFLDGHPDLARQHTWAMPLVLGAITTATGFASTVGRGASVMVAFALVAAMIAGSETSLVASLSVTAAGVLAIEVGGLIFGGSYGTFIGSPVLVVGGLMFGRNRGAYRIQAEQAAQLLAQQERLQAEQRRADLLDERTRIAREIHDVLAHSLGALGIQIQAARAVLADHGDVDQAGELLAAAQQMASEGLVETRRAVQALRTDPPPLNEELAQVSDTYAQRYRVGVDYDTSGSPVPLPPDASLALLRVAQEALVNAAKHAPHQAVAIRLDYRDDDVRLTVRNGLPSSVVTPGALRTVNGGYGLTGMRERLRLLNGSLDAGRRDDEWVVTAELPRPAPESMTS